MTRKLTLSINEKTVEKARRISRKRGKSISRMVEEYLNSITEKDKQQKSAVDKIKGILKGKITNKNLDWKKVKEEYLSKKYGI
jgi:replicative DNA helicase